MIQLSEYSIIHHGSEEIIYAVVYNFPVQIICLEKMEDTLDSSLDDDDGIKMMKKTVKEWASCLFQIIMMLITYQKVFDFTHNDFHTNNIMYH